LRNHCDTRISSNQKGQVVFGREVIYTARMMFTGKGLIGLMGGLLVQAAVLAVQPQGSGRAALPISNEAGARAQEEKPSSASTAISGSVASDDSGDERNYRVIVDRNPFGLKPIPPPPTNAPPVEKSKDEILLTGITSIGGLRAYFMTKAPAGKNPEYYSLGVDEKKDALEVMAIDLTEKSVRVRNAGVESIMTFAANGVKTPATPNATPGAPGATLTTTTRPGVPGASPPTPGTAGPVGAPAQSPVSRMRSVPSRTTTVSSNPMLPVGGAPMPTTGAANYSSPEADLLMMELQRQANPNIQFPPPPIMPGSGPAIPGSGPGIPAPTPR
jgi:hypothetical protein